MRPPKFAVGDKVRLNKVRVPIWLRSLRLDTPRTIVFLYRTGKGGAGKHVRYYLGSNGMGSEELATYSFRSSDLILYVKGAIGRPRTKRRYTKRKDKNHRDDLEDSLGGNRPDSVSTIVDLEHHQAFCA